MIIIVIVILVFVTFFSVDAYGTKMNFPYTIKRLF